MNRRFIKIADKLLRIVEEIVKKESEIMIDDDFVDDFLMKLEKKFPELKAGFGGYTIYENIGFIAYYDVSEEFYDSQKDNIEKCAYDILRDLGIEDAEVKFRYNRIRKKYELSVEIL